jgi:hypothetical protein
MSAPSELVKVSLGRPELLAFAESNIAFVGLDCSRISSIFLAQLLHLYASRTISICNVTAEIKSMEGVGPKLRTVREKMFKTGTTLEGLHYKHFTDARFIVKNIGSEFGYENGGNEKLDNLVGKLFHKQKGQYVTEDFDRSFAHESTIGAMSRRARRGAMTGEWIVFKKCKGKRFYLCLAAHTETNEQIFVRVKNAIAMDFQFLEAGG